MADTVELRSLEGELQSVITQVADTLGAGGEREAKALRKSADELMLQAKCAVEWAVSASSAEEITTAEEVVGRAVRQARESISTLQAATPGPPDQLRVTADRVHVQLHAEAQSAKAFRKPGKGKRLGVGAPTTDWGAMGQSIGFAFIALVIIGGIGYGLFAGDLLKKLGDQQQARGLITFLVAIAAVAIAIILTLSATVSRADELDKRVTLGKEMLTALIGVLGTIVGFYFGTASSTAPITTPTPPPIGNVPGNVPASGPGNGPANPGVPGGPR